MKRKQEIRMHPSSQAGAGLLQVLFGTAILGFAAATLASLLSNNFKSSAKSKQDTDKSAITMFLINNRSCSETLPSSTCTPGSLVELKRKTSDGRVKTMLTNSGTGTRFGRWAMRAVCNTTGDGFRLEGARLRPGASISSNSPGDFLPDPLKNKVITWSDTREVSLLPEGLGSLCLAKKYLDTSITDPTNPMCTQINIPFRPDRRQRRIYLQKCPESHPFFSGIWLTQEDVGKKSDLMKKIQCCR